jgi:hypothetical protein
LTQKQLMQVDDHVRIRFDPENTYFAEVENIWALPHTEGGYVIDNVPFFVPGISIGDRVGAKNIDDRLWATAIIEKGSPGTIRVTRFSEHSAGDLETLKTLFPRFRELGADVEVAQDIPLLALSFSADRRSVELRAELHRLYRREEIAIEESDVPDWWVPLD